MSKRKNDKKIIYVSLIIMIIVLALLISNSMSKYIIRIRDIHAQESTAFYFESEIADVDGNEYKINNWDGTEQAIKIDIKNYTSNLLKTSQNIRYTINAKIIENSSDTTKNSELIETIIYDKANTRITENQEFTLEKGKLSQDTYTLSIIPKVANLEDGKTFNIELTISSIEPYTKELKANIKITVNEMEDYIATLSNSSNGEYSILNLKVNNPNDITIKYDNTKLILDRSNSLINDVQITTTENIDTFIIDKSKLEEKNYEIHFIKQQESIILGTDIICE